MALHRAGLDLEIRDGGAELRVPVDEALVAIQQALPVKLNEHLLDGFRKAFVHGETLVRPIARRAEPPELAGDRPARLRFPFPDMLKKRLAAHIGALLTLAFEQPLDHHRSEEHTSELQSLMRLSYA